jgi:hypothetical protein
MSTESTAAAPDAAPAALPRPIVRGRLLRAGEVDKYGNAVTLDELRAVNLRGKPLMFEHQQWGGRVGTITDSYVDGDGWLWIAGEVFSESDQPGREFPGWLRKQLRDGALRDLSVGVTYEADAARRRTGPRRFHEASLVARGAYKGTHLVAVQASSSSSTTSASDVVAQLVCKLDLEFPSNLKMTTPAPSDGASATPAGIAGNFGVQDALNMAATAGLALTHTDVSGRSVFEIMQMVAKHVASKDDLVAEAAQIKKRDTERHAAEMRPRFDQFKQVAAELGVTGGLDLVEDIFMEQGATDAAKTVSAMTDALAQRTKKLAEYETRMAQIEKELSEATAREQLSLANQRKRLPDGRFQQELPRMATGGATATTTGGGGGGETVSVEASAAKSAHTVPAGTLAKILRAKHYFPHATFAPALLEQESGGEVAVEASHHSMAGGVSQHELSLIQRIVSRQTR